jgi:hypothetical protein
MEWYSKDLELTPLRYMREMLRNGPKIESPM